MQLVIRLTLLIAHSLPSAPADSFFEGPEVYEIALGAALPALPPELREMLEPDLQELRDAVVTLGDRTARRPPAQDEQSNHFVLLDVAAADDDDDSRRRAAQSFPQDRSEARRLYDGLGVRAGGWLPWILLAHNESLVEAFQHGDASKISAETAAVLHFAVDAAMPFQTTARGAAWRTKGEADESATSKTGENGRLRERFQGELVRRIRPRLEYEVRIWPQRVVRLDDPLKTIFEVCRESRKASDRLAAIDAEILQDLGIRDLEGMVSRADRYATMLADQAAPILETQIEAGALLGAKLVLTAWMRAGRPSLDLEPQPSSPPAEPSVDVVEPPLFVGSLSSTVYHRASCAHASRISKDNVVEYPTAAEAEAAGRKPCKACKPELP